MAWIESHTVLIRHRKLKELAKDLRLKPVYVLGHLHVLWHAALEQAEDGDLSSWTDEFIADSACYPGSAPQFVSLLQKHKWLDGKLIHDWLDTAGRYLDAKYRTSNPARLKAIIAKHENNKNSLQSDFSQTLDSPDEIRVPRLERINKYVPDFEPIWKRYPNKDGRKEALRHFLASVKTPEDLKQINLALDNYLKHLGREVWKNPKNAKTWFNNWRDWINDPMAKDKPVKTEWVKDPKCTLCDEFGYVHYEENKRVWTQMCKCLKKVVTPI